MLHDRPCLHIDLSTANALQAVKIIRSWIVRHGIKILNIAGLRVSEDSEIYNLNLAPTFYYGLKRFAFKARFMILILTIWVICLRVKITPTSL
jgi:hypothetical protein